MKRFILVLASVLFLSGCIFEPAQPVQQQAPPAQQYLCPDGVNVVANLNTCPPYDREYEECLDMQASSDYYGSSSRDECFFNLALQRENVSLCKKVLANDLYSDFTSGKCGALMAISADDPRVCEELGMVGKYDCYAELATQLEDPYMCDYITLSSKKDDCLYSYLSVNSYYIEDWSFCDKLSEKSDNRDYCLNQAAYYTGTASYCDRIQGDGGYFGYSQPSCYASVAKQKDDPTVCSGLSTTPKRDDCYYDYASTYPYDESACNRITDGSKKSRCVDYTNDSYY